MWDAIVPVTVKLQISECRLQIEFQIGAISNQQSAISNQSEI
jgi:hypothetical protein